MSVFGDGSMNKTKHGHQTQETSIVGVGSEMFKKLSAAKEEQCNADG